MADLRRGAGRVGGFLTALVLTGVSACAAGGPSRRELERIATSAEVEAARERTERELDARVQAVRAAVPWLETLSVIVYDQCRDVRGNAHLFDPAPPGKTALVCRMSAYVVFSADRTPPGVVADVRASGVTQWTESSVNDTLAYYGKDSGGRLSDRYVPSLTSVSGGPLRESLRWDTERAKVSVSFPEGAVWSRLVHRYGEKSLEALRREKGPLYLWAFHTDAYHRVP
ncbi:hypothetical protein [Streptomyces termitum]|uniref:hypothetical protein n=1 Tax=Streptomyces termitum TaxID=67368 RepID=UPI0037A0F93B